VHGPSGLGPIGIDEAEGSHEPLHRAPARNALLTLGQIKEFSHTLGQLKPLKAVEKAAA